MRPVRATLLVFLLGAVGVLAALGFLTRHALRLEASERDARREAKFQESVRLVLWRMDSAITPIIAREAARPYFQYEPFYPTDRAWLGDGAGAPSAASSEPATPAHAELRKAPASPPTVQTTPSLVPSPLLRNDDPFVLLHFQKEHDAPSSVHLVSPQVPQLDPSPNQVFVPSYQLAENALRLRTLTQVYRDVSPDLPALPVDQAIRGALSDLDAAVAAGPPPPQSAPAAEHQRQEEQASANEYIARSQQVANVVRQQLRADSSAKPVAPGAPSAVTAPAPPAAAASEPPAELARIQAALKDKLAKSDDTRDAEGDARRLAGESDRSSSLAPGEAGDAPNGGATPGSPAAGADEKFFGAAATRARAEPSTGFALGSDSKREQAKEHPASHDPEAPADIEQGAFAPRWLVRPGGDAAELVFERRVRVGGREVTQGFWLDWPALRAMLLDSSRGLVPDADLRPLLGGIDRLPAGALGRTLAAIPAELVVPSRAAPPAPSWSPLRTTLLATWGLALGAVLAIGLVLRSATELAERRGRFVSAVTHELRTPLTTFVMYSQMLADGIVKGDDARSEYLATLKRESQRLARIVESVLDYARLGKRRPATVRATRRADQVLGDLVPVLAARCEQAGMTLDVAREGDLSFEVTTDPATLERILYNLVDNACKYAAAGPDRRVHLAARPAGRDLLLAVRDHGPGVPAPERRAVFRPFTRGRAQSDGSVPGLGLGLSLAAGLAKELGGELRLSPEGPGAEFLLRVPGA